jgi:hypothetical protein
MPYSAVRFGLVGAAVTLVISFLLFLFGITFSSYWWVAGLIRFLLTIFFIILSVKAVKLLRINQNGTITFTEAFGTSMIIFLFVLVTNIGFNLLLYNVIDKGYSEKVKMFTIEKMENQLDNPIFDEDIKESILGAFESQSFEYKMRNAVKSLGIFVIFYTIISLIIAAAIHKDVNLNAQT